MTPCFGPYLAMMAGYGPFSLVIRHRRPIRLDRRSTPYYNVSEELACQPRQIVILYSVCGRIGPPCGTTRHRRSSPLPLPE